MVYSVLSDVSSGVAEFKKNPMAVLAQGEGAPIAVLSRNKPVFYAVPAQLYEKIMEQLEDIELVKLVKERQDQEEVSVSIDDL